MMMRTPFVENERFVIYSISDEDRDNYVELHRQLNGEQTLYLNPLSKDMLWEQTLHGTTNVFSIFTVDKDYCGSIELQKPESKTPELGIDLLVNKRNKGIALEVVPLFARKHYELKEIDYFWVRISSHNPHSKHVFEKLGAIKIGEEETEFQRFSERFKEIMEEQEQDIENYRHLFGESDDEVVYRYKLDPSIFCKNT